MRVEKFLEELFLQNPINKSILGLTFGLNQQRVLKDKL
jgi:hypothetical protein